MYFLHTLLFLESLTPSENSHAVTTQQIGVVMIYPQNIAILRLLDSLPRAAGVEALQPLLELLSHETKLILDYSLELSTENLLNLMHALEHNSSIKSIKFMDIPFDVEIAQGLAKVLDRNPRLKKLKLQSSIFDEDTAQVLALALESNTTLKSLDLSSNLQEFTGIIQALEHNRGLSSVSLSHNKIGPEQARILAKVLEHNETLTSLDLSWNPITKAGGERLAKGLEKNTTLRTLKLNRTIDCLGYDSTRGVTLRNGQQKSLRVQLDREEEMHYDGVGALISQIANNTSLTLLELRDNRIGPMRAKALRNALKKNSNLKILNLESTSLTDEGIEFIAQGLEENSSLTHLCLKNCHSGVRGLRAIAQALEHNSTLERLDIIAHSSQEIDVLRKALDKRKVPVDITLTKCSMDDTPFSVQKKIKEFNAYVQLRQKAWAIAQQRLAQETLSEPLGPAVMKDMVVQYLGKESNNLAVKNPDLEPLVEHFMNIAESKMNIAESKFTSDEGTFFKVKRYLTKIRQAIVSPFRWIWDKITALWSPTRNADLSKSTNAVQTTASPPESLNSTLAPSSDLSNPLSPQDKGPQTTSPTVVDSEATNVPHKNKK